MAVFAFSQRSDAREQARVAKGGQLVASALSLLDSDPELGLALAVEAARIDPTPRAEDALRQALDASRERAVTDVGHPLVGLELDRFGLARALVVDAGHVARLIDLHTGAEVWSHRVDGAAAAFAPDGRTVASSSAAVAASTSTRTTGKPSGSRSGCAVPGTSSELVASPDGTSAIVVAGKPRARVVALATGSPIGRVKQAPRVTDAAFGPSGRLVASAAPTGRPDSGTPGHG